MKTQELIPAANLAAYNAKVDLAVVRRDPDTYPRIGKTTQDEAVARMIPIVYGAVLYSGQEISRERLNFTATALVAEILSDTKYGLRFLSWFEIGMAIRDAVLGGSDRPLYGISVSTLYRALVDYARGEGHDAQRRAATSSAPAREATADAIAEHLADKFTRK